MQFYKVNTMTFAIHQTINTKDSRTQCQQVKEHLEAGGKLSTFDAYRLFNITCLAQRVHDLRHRFGYDIISNNVTHNGKRFVVYTWGNNPTAEQPVTDDDYQDDQQLEATASAPVTGE